MILSGAEPKPEGGTQMIFSDVIIRATANATGSKLQKLETRLAAAEAELLNKQAALNALLTADEDGRPVMEAEDALAAAERRCRNLRGALATAQAKQATQQAEAEQDAKRAAWQAAVRAAEARHAAIERLAKSMAAFGADYNAVLKTNEALRAALPANGDDIANMTDRATIETVLRKELVRVGLPWCFSWPYGPATLPELMPQFEGALNVIRSSVPKDLQ